ncbi:hypothetical protein AB0284_20130 [Pseudarthrobacter phenanthrenivorans]|uniref:hypothetical protein n=1 Tax=Pseudarthrobacter phenanthrenivorans TaxID=361575 RepID=UPI00344E0C16
MPAFQAVTPDPIEALVKTASSLPASTFSDRDFVKRVAVRAFSLGLSEDVLVGFLKKQTANRPGLPSLLSERFAFRPLIASCRRAALSSSPAGADDNAVKTARLTLGRILTPVEVDETGAPLLSPAKQIRARATLAVLCVEQIKSIRSEQGWNTIMVSYPWLSLRMGVSWPTAKDALKDLVAMGWIHEVSGARPDSARRFKISGNLRKEDQAPFVKQVKDEAGQVIEPGLYDAIGALAGNPGDPGQKDLLLASLTRSVTHPAWTYGTDPLSFKVWLLTLARVAGVDPVQLGIQKRSIPALNRVMNEAGLDLLIGSIQGDTTSAGNDLPAQLADALNAWADRAGSVAAAMAAKDGYKAATADRTKEIATVRQLRADARPAVDKLLGATGAIPAAGAPEDRRTRWVERASQVAATDPLVGVWKDALTWELKRRLKAKGYDRDAITLLASQVMSHAQPLLGTKETIPLAQEDPAVKTAWLQTAAREMQGRPMRPAERDAFEKELLGRLRSRGYEEPKAVQVANLLFKDVALAA